MNASKAASPQSSKIACQHPIGLRIRNGCRNTYKHEHTAACLGSQWGKSIQAFDAVNSCCLNSALVLLGQNGVDYRGLFNRLADPFVRFRVRANTIPLRSITVIIQSGGSFVSATN